MNRAVQKITVDLGTGVYFRAGDVLRLTTTGEALQVIAMRGSGRRHWEPIPLRRAVWNWLRGRGWERTLVTEYWRGTMRVVRLRPSPLPRRLP